MNETTSAPPNREHELLLEAGRFLVAVLFHLASPTHSVCCGSLKISISHRRSPEDRERTSCSPTLAVFSPLQRGVLRSGGEGHMGPK